MSILSKAKKLTGKIIGISSIISGYSLITSSWNDMTKRSKPNYISRNESFESALKREQTSEKELKKIYNNYLLIWCTMWAANMVSLFYFIAYIEKGSIGAFGMIGYMTLILSINVEKSFRLYQIKTRNLCSFDEWLLAKNSFIPSFYPTNPNGVLRHEKPI